VETAKVIGIFDKNAYYAGRQYANVKTFNPIIDSETARSEELCRQSITGAQATPVCAVVPTAGVGTTAKAGAPGKCITHGCPTGFEESRDGVCKKPLEDALVSKKSRCDERWTDWFMIPNYHLGNKFYSVGPGKCYAPCAPGQVPAYARDPVDEAALDFSSTDDVGMCVDRDEYFNGKYTEGSEFCPLAWVHRLGVTARQVEGTLQTAYDAAMTESGGTKNTHMVDAERERREAAIAIVNAAGEAMEPVEAPGETQTAACRKLATTERLQDAYDICEAIQTNEELFMKKLEDENGDSSLKQEQKTMVLKTACNALFCNEKWDPYTAEIISREPICIKNIKGVDLSAKDKAGDVAGPLPNARKQQDFFRTSVGRAVQIIMICIFGTLFYFFITLFVWPKIVVPTWELIKRILTGWKGSDYDKKFAATEDLLMNPEPSSAGPGPATRAAVAAPAPAPAPAAAPLGAAPAMAQAVASAAPGLRNRMADVVKAKMTQAKMKMPSFKKVKR